MIVLYVLEGCPYCNNALKLLKAHKIKYMDIVVENTVEKKNFYKKQNKMVTFPQIFMQINEDNFMKIGGYSELEEVIDKCIDIKNSMTPLDAIYHMYQKLFGK